MGLKRVAWIEARSRIQSLLSDVNSILRDTVELRSKAFIKQSEAIMHLPAEIGMEIFFKFGALSFFVVFRRLYRLLFIYLSRN
jgi:hypothetical protein